MKRLPSLLLSLVLSLALLGPRFCGGRLYGSQLHRLYLRRGNALHGALLPQRRQNHPRRKRGRMRRQPSGRGCADPNGRKHRRWARRTSSRSPFYLLRDPNHPLITNLSLRAPNRPLTDLSRGIPHSYFPKAAVKSCRFFALFLRIFLLQFVFNCCILSTVNSK